jgi:spore germination protein KC
LFKNRGKLILLLVPALLLTGCWDSQDVSDLNLGAMVILDRQGDELSFTVEIAKITPPGEGGGGGGGTKQTYLTGAGANFAEARDALDMQMDKPLFLGTVRTLVITERAAAGDLAEYLFRLRENQEYRQKVNITITAEEPEAFEGFENESDEPAGYVIDDTIQTATELGHTCAVTTEKYVNDILAGRGFVVQNIGFDDKQIKLNGYSVFRDAKLVGFIPIEESRGLTYISGRRPVWVYRLPGAGGFVTAEVELASRDVKPSYRDGKVKFEVKLAFRATIQYKSGTSLFPLNEKNIKEYSDSLRRVLKSEVDAAIQLSQRQFRSDYMSFGEALRIAYPDEFEKMDWAAEYPKAEIETEMSVDCAVSDKLDIEAS